MSRLLYGCRDPEWTGKFKELTVEFKGRNSLTAIVVLAAPESSKALRFGLEFAKALRLLRRLDRIEKLAGCTHQFGGRD